MIRSVVHVAHELIRGTKKNWLVVGKGPSSDLLAQVPLDGLLALTLNHACKIVTPTVAHFVDVDAYEQCAEHLAGLACHVCLPWYPHVNNRAGKKTLAEYPWATALGDRLLTYNATTASGRPKNPMVHNVRLRYFSAVAAFNIVVMCGNRDVRSIGVDGGTEYGSAFATDTKLANGRQSFDIQTKELTDALKRSGGKWIKLPDTQDRAPDPAPPPPDGQHAPVGAVGVDAGHVEGHSPDLGVPPVDGPR